MLTVVKHDEITDKTIVKRSHNDKVYEFQVHCPDNSVQGFHVEERFGSEEEANVHIEMS